jgi:hypothetical protein
MPDERHVTLPFYALRLKNLVDPKARLVVMCKACRRSGRAEVLPLVHKLGPEFGVKDCELRLVCSHCHQKGWASVTVEWF